jgi:hypothetical protein
VRSGPRLIRRRQLVEAPAKLIASAATLGDYDTQPGVMRIGAGADTHEEEFRWNAAEGRWIGLERVVLTTTDSWAMDLSRCPIVRFANAWAKFSGGVGWQAKGPRTGLRSAVTLPTGTINIADPSGGALASSGQVLIRDQLVTFGGVVTTPGAMQLTGCSGGTGSFPADLTPVIPWSSGAIGGGDPGGWGTTVTPLDRVSDLWTAGFRLEERANAWLNGSCDLFAMEVAPFFFNYNLDESMGSNALYAFPNLPPVAGMLGPGLKLTGPAYDMAGFDPPGEQSVQIERGFEMRHASWTAWTAGTPTKRFLSPVLYGRMPSGAQDNGQVYGWTHRMRWVTPSS